jgi:hypothetical protein
MDVSRKNGFVLVLVIIVISLLGVAMLVLTDVAKTLLFQTDRAYLEAVEDNLTAGALAWSRQNVRSLTTEPNKVVELDTSAMRLRDSKLTVQVKSVTDTAVTIQVSTSCKKGRLALTGCRQYKIVLT